MFGTGISQVIFSEIVSYRCCEKKYKVDELSWVQQVVLHSKINKGHWTIIWGESRNKTCKISQLVNHVGPYSLLVLSLLFNYLPMNTLCDIYILRRGWWHIYRYFWTFKTCLKETLYGRQKFLLAISYLLFLLVTRFFLLLICYFLLFTWYCFLVTSYVLLVTRYYLPFTRYFLLATRYFLLVTRCFLLIICYFLLVTRYFFLLLVATYWVLTALYLYCIALYSLNYIKLHRGFWKIKHKP